MGIKTSTNADGSVNVSTTDGVNLVSNTYATAGLFRRRPERHLWQYHHPGHQSRTTASLIGSPTPLDPHLSGGSLKGLIDMRDQVLGGLTQSLGNLAQQTRAGLQRPGQRQCRLSAAHLADRPRYRPAVHRRAEFHRQDHPRRHRFQRQSGVAHRCEFRRRHLVGGWRRAAVASAPPSAVSPPR